MCAMYTYYIRFVNGIHECWVLAIQVALSEAILRWGNNIREEHVYILLCIVVREHSRIVDLGRIYGLQGVFIWVLGLELP